MNDPATADRRRLDVLLGLAADDDLKAAAPQPAEVDGSEWATGFEDAAAGVRLAVYFVRDPAVRARVADELQIPSQDYPAVRVSTNGGMLAVGRGRAGQEAERRLNALLSAFAGRE
ncbi:MAG: hypothetical protein M3063_13410 [Actinomycetota bacterium]|nr:hypothetical protein [Actinomycetota bacterium]